MKKLVIAVDRIYKSVATMSHVCSLYMCALYYLTKCMYMYDLATTCTQYFICSYSKYEVLR